MGGASYNFFGPNFLPDFSFSAHAPRLSLSLYLGRKGKAGERRTREEKQLFLGPFTHFRPRPRAPGQPSVGDQRDAGGAEEEGRKFESKARMFINGRRALGPRVRQPNPDRHPGTEDSFPATTGAAGERTNELTRH